MVGLRTFLLSDFHIRLEYYKSTDCQLWVQLLGATPQTDSYILFQNHKKLQCILKKRSRGNSILQVILSAKSDKSDQ